jgi:hypothetical protein
MAGGLQLGPVLFQDFEVPARVRFGGKQRLAVHQLPGGGRVVDVMGADEGALRWSGVFSGAGAAERASLLDGMRRGGAVWPVSWAGSRYTVVIEAFEADQMNPAWIPYRLSLCVVAVGDPVVAELLPEGATIAEAGLLGAGPGVDGQIAVAASGLQSADVGTTILAAGSLARLVTGRSLLIAAGGIAS